MKTLDFDKPVRVNRLRTVSMENEHHEKTYTTNIKELDLICLSLQKQIQALTILQNHKQNQHKNSAESLYSGDPDSLDGTVSSDDVIEEDDNYFGEISHIYTKESNLFQNLTLPSRVIHHQESRKHVGIEDEFDSGEGLSETTSLLFHHQQTLVITQLERLRDELNSQNVTLKDRLNQLTSKMSLTHLTVDQVNNNHMSPTPSSQLAPISHPVEDTMETTFTVSDISSDPDVLRLQRKSTYKISPIRNSHGNENDLRPLVQELQLHEQEIKQELECLKVQFDKSEIELKTTQIEKEGIEGNLRVLQGQLDSILKEVEVTQENLHHRHQEIIGLKLDLEALTEENQRLKAEINSLHQMMESAQNQGLEKLCGFQREIELLVEEKKSLDIELSQERLLRKRYYNLAEELKGKIRVFCRIRPPSKSEKSELLVTIPTDHYTVTVKTGKGSRDFLFDRVFHPEDSQETIFADTRNLIESAFDGYNVCCLSYGQTGSGKSYTILGDENSQGIASRTFSEIFIKAQKLQESHETRFTFYCLELYNDRLIDLLNQSSPYSRASPINPLQDSPDTNRLEIRRDKSGIVWISGARVVEITSSQNLEKNVRSALHFRHTASTRMNDRSSRSHLIIGINVETTTRSTGNLLRGKISLLDLAGSERTGRTGVTGDILKEAGFINKSLSALGDVINALNSEQTFIPYRNNKLTLLLQDSIGGNAKTLMFVNVSPTISNMDETLVSLTYAMRVKQVVNSATRNSESKEIARLRNVISRMRNGETWCVDDELF